MRWPVEETTANFACVNITMDWGGCQGIFSMFLTGFHQANLNPGNFSLDDVLYWSGRVCIQDAQPVA